MQDHGATSNEVAVYLDGSKLKEKIEFADLIVKRLGKKVLTPATHQVLKECKTVRKLLSLQNRSALWMILSILRDVMPMVMISIVIRFVGSLGHAEFDKQLFSGRIAGDAIRSDGSFDSAVSFDLMINLVVTCALWWLS